MFLKFSFLLFPALLFAFNLFAQSSRPSLSAIPSTRKPTVAIIYMQEKKPTNAETIGKLNSMQLNETPCGIAELLAAAQTQAALKGGNALYVTSIEATAPFAKCFSIEAEILKLKEPYSSEPNPAYPAELRNTTAGDSINLTEILPVFPGGREGMMNFLNTNVKYPPAAVKDRVSGKVTVSCVLDTTGTLTDISVSEGLHPALDQEAIRIISAMPEWSPGYQNGKAVPIKMTLPIRFTIQGKAPKRSKKDKN